MRREAGEVPGPELPRRVGRALELMEARLGEPLALEEAAGEAAWSLHHFHRAFSSFMGIGPGAYLRRRRLSEAARDLVLGEMPAREIALKWGFGSAEAFSRSFAAGLGSPPGAYRRRARCLAPMGPFEPVARPLLGLSRPGPWHGVASYAIVTRGETLLLGRSRELPLAGDALGKGCSELRAEVAPALRGLASPAGDRLFGIGFASTREPGRALRYALAVEAPPGRAGPAGFESLSLPGGEYLRAVHRGPASLVPASWLEIYASILPRLGRQPLGDLDFDIEVEPGPCPEGGGFELYVPLLPLRGS